MAAPNNAYRNKSLWMRGGTTNYEHKVAILQEDKATMLERFYLDDLVSVKVDGTNDGVIGAVIIGGDNEKMHNIATRGGVGRVRVNGQTARLLNDAGLNTRAKAEATAMRSRFINQGIEFDATITPGWYVPCALYVRFQKSGVSGWSEWFEARAFSQGNNYSGGVTYELERFWNMFDIFGSYAAGDVYTMQVKTTSPEGEWIGGTKSVTIVPQAVKMKRGASPQEAYESTTFYDVYPSTPFIDVGTFLYEDAGMELPLSGGYHMLDDSTSWYRLNTLGEIVEKGAYSPYPNFVYNIYVQRLGTGNKFGEFEVTGEIAASISGSGGYSGDVFVTVGTHDGSFGNFDTYQTFSFPSTYLNPGDSLPIYESGDIDESYASYIWGYRITVNSVILYQGSL